MSLIFFLKPSALVATDIAGTDTASLTLVETADVFVLIEVSDTASLTLTEVANVDHIDAAEAVSDQPSGGAIWWARYEREMARIRRLRKKQAEEEDDTESIQDAIDREIAQLLKRQDAQDATRREIERLRSLAREYDGGEIDARFARALANAANARTLAAAMALEREIRRVNDEDDFLMSAFMAIIDD